MTFPKAVKEITLFRGPSPPEGFSFSDSIFLFVFLALGYFSRNWIIEHPNICVFDETHFGNFTNSYNQNTYFFDIHPPLAKLWIAGITKLQGYNATVVFNHTEYHDNYYIDLRFAVSCFSSLVPSLSFLTLRFIGVDLYLSVLAGIFLTAEPMLIIEGRLILTDGILHCFTLFAILSVAYLVGHTNIYSIVVSAFFIGCAFSIKYTAGGLTVFIAFQQFFQICNGNIFDLFKFPTKDTTNNNYSVFNFDFLQKFKKNKKILTKHKKAKQSSESDYSSDYSSDSFENEHKKKLSNFFVTFAKTKFWELCMRGVVIAFVAISVLILAFAIHVIVMKFRDYYSYNEISNEYEESLLWKWETDYSRHVKIMGLLKRIFVSIFRMQQINNMCTKHGGFESTWKQWPIVNIHSLIYAHSPGYILMFPNPLTWISALLGPILLTLFILIFGFKNPQLWQHIIWPIGYAVSLFPFILVPRTTYVYHYLISLIFGVLSLSVFLDILFSKNKIIVDAISFVFIITAFILLIFYLPITSAMSHYYLQTKPWKDSLRYIYNTDFTIV